MNAELALVELLQQDARVNTLVKGRIAAWEDAQYSDLPLIRYHRISTERSQNFGAPDALAFANIQVDCLAATYKAAKQLADRVRVAVNGYRGRLGKKKVCGTFAHPESDFREEIPGAEKPVYGVQQEYRIAHYEDVR